MKKVSFSLSLVYQSICGSINYKGAIPGKAISSCIRPFLILLMACFNGVGVFAQTPTLGAYSAATVTYAGGNTTVTPAAAPTNTVYLTAITNTNFKGVLSVNSSGVVRVTDAHPAGIYKITVIAFSPTDTVNRSFNLTVGNSVAAGTFTNSSNLSLGDEPANVAIGDFDNNDIQDIAIVNYNDNNVSIRLGNGSGGFTGSTNITVGINPGNVAIGDFNGDGNQDLATSNEGSNTISIRLGDGSGGFSGSTDISVSNAPVYVAVGDFNGDGRQDIVSANLNDDISVRLGDGGGGFTGSTNVSVGLDPRGLAIGDFDGDGDKDLAVANSNSNNASILLGDGSGGFSFSSNITVSNNPSCVVVGDFNEDNKQDLGIANSNSGTVSIRLGDGSGGFTGSTNVSMGSFPCSAVIGDFNADGHQDIATSSANSHAIFTALGDGSGNFSGISNVAVGGNHPIGIAAGDFNSDGMYDLVTSNKTGDNASILLGEVPHVNIAGSTGVNGNYVTLAAAFTAINGGGSQSGNSIIITLNGNTTEPSSGASLSVGTWTSMSIKPAGGQARSISGAPSAGVPLINLSGADNVIIDGLNSAGNSLTISNTSASASPNTSTIRFINGATNNAVRNCTILGSFSGGIAASGGNILFANDVATPNGNDGNTISNNNIGPAGSNLPVKCIHSAGSSTPSGKYNSGNTISGNNIYDYFSATLESSAIYLGAGTADWTISNNKFYQTSTRTQTGSGAMHTVIYLASSQISNCIISGNTIGYSSNSGTGTYTLVGVTGSMFYPIYITFVNTSVATNIISNTITAINMSGSITSPDFFAGIYVNSGLVNIGTGSIANGNTIGSISAASAITLTNSTTSDLNTYGILTKADNNPNISNNKIGGITTNNTSTGDIGFYAINANNSSTAVNTIYNNTIGYAAAPLSFNDVNLIKSGIYVQTGIALVTGNTIAYINTSLDFNGIKINNNSSTQANNISQNTIHSINASPSVSVSPFLRGILISQSSTLTHTITRNNIHSFSHGGSSNASSSSLGIEILDGTGDYYNNMIRLGYDASGSNAGDASIYGIYESGGTNNLYFNSVYIGGTGVASNNNSYAIYSSVSSVTRNYKDNIFYNARSTSSGTGKNYSISVSNTSGLTSDYNDIYVSGTGGIPGYFSADYNSLPAWQTATGQDAHSKNSDPQYINPTGTSITGDLHIHATNVTEIEANGIDISGIVDDYDGQTRASFTPTDIGADAGNFTGSVTIINIKGNNNGLLIADHDQTPSFTDSTNFGNKIINTSLVRRYVIHNIGGTNLTLTGASLTGTNADQFVISGVSSSSPIAPGDTAAFTVTFTPTSTGSKTATVHITNDDATYPDYDFDILGSGINTYTYSGTGNWTDPANWSPSYPGITIPPGIIVIILGGSNLSIPNGTTIVNNGILQNNGTLTIPGSGIFTNNGTYKGTGNFPVTMFVNPPNGIVSPGD